MTEPNNRFREIAEQERDVSLPRELFHFMAKTKKWWLAPLVALMMLLVVLVYLSSSAAAPFIYTIF